jgi:hypothetical protein
MKLEENGIKIDKLKTRWLVLRWRRLFHTRGYSYWKARAGKLERILSLEALITVIENRSET